MDDGEQKSSLTNTFSEDGTVSLATVSFSDVSNIVAYMTSTGGSDWREIYVMDANTKEFIGETLQDVKFSGLSWYKNEGFYYEVTNLKVLN